MCQKVLPKTSFEERLPEGWFLSRLYRGNRILYYKDIKVVSLPDSFDIESRVADIINNPPESVQAALYQDGKLAALDLSPNVQQKLVKKGIISYEFALNCLHGIESWLYRYIPTKAEYAGVTYKNKRNRWYDEDGNCINTSVIFLSTWDARVRYAKGMCTLADVARYSWAAVLECLGDDHQRFIETVIKPKLIVNKKGWVVEAKDRKKERLNRNAKWEYTEFDCSREIENDYREDVNSCLYNYFFDSISNQVQMFTENCRIPAFKGMNARVKKWEQNVVEQLKSIEPRLCRFKWNPLLKAHEPVFAPRVLSYEKREDFYDLVHQVIIGSMSGHQAALHMVNGDWKKIKREGNRYEKHMTQYVPYYTDRWKKLNPNSLTFTDAVRYVQSNVKDLITMGFRAADKLIASFTYDDCRFSVNVMTGEVHYIGVAEGKYMSDRWLRMKPEQRRAVLNDDAEWKYQEKAIKRYNRLFSYLYNVVHKHWDRVSYFIKDKLTAKKKYLRPSSRFLDKMREKAEKYIKSLERGVVTC